jgi:hypothetical protein
MPVPDFSPGEVLTAAAMDSIGLWLVKSQTIGTGVSSVTVTDAFSSNYDSYKIVVSGGVGSTAQLIGLRLGGSTTGYYSNFIFGSYNGASVSYAAVNNGTQFVYGGVSTTGLISVQCELVNPFLAKTTSFYGVYTEPTAPGGSAGPTQGFHNVASSFTDFTLLVGGTLTGGTIRVYGYRN